MKGIHIALLASLALNLLFAGVLGGAAIARHQRHEIGFGGGGLSQALKGFPPSERMVVRRMVTEGWRNSAAERDEARAARKALVDAIVAEPFDQAKVEAALARMRTADAAVTAQFHAASVAHLRELSAEDRAKFARAVMVRRPGGWMRPRPGDPAPAHQAPLPDARPKQP